MTGPESLRIIDLNGRPVAEDGDYVLYWLTAARRTAHNRGLERAVDWANRLARPLVILEALRLDYPWASRRLHAFILRGMDDNRQALADRPVRYHPFVETEPGQGKGLLAALAERAAMVVTDHFPCFFLPRMIRAAAGRVKVRLEAVDSCGLLPLAQPGREFKRAVDFRRYLQKHLPPHLAALSSADPLAELQVTRRAVLPRSVLDRWPPAERSLLRARPERLAALAVDQTVAETAQVGGRAAGLESLRKFVAHRLERYYDQARHPAAEATSRLSAYLHFGHLAAEEVFAAVARREGWTPDRLPLQARGAKEGWWGMSRSAEAFLDQLVTWRELGYGFCHYRGDYDRYSSLPDWARATLEEHAEDGREYLYPPDQLDRAQTHDRLWNAIQRQLVREGTIDTYLRMVWGKKILEWGPHPRRALETMIDLNNRYALDGRDPNSYSGVFWILGRFDRAWGPERPVVGKVRYMSSANTRRKLKLGDYLERYAD